MPNLAAIRCTNDRKDRFQCHAKSSPRFKFTFLRDVMIVVYRAVGLYMGHWVNPGHSPAVLHDMLCGP